MNAREEIEWVFGEHLSQIGKNLLADKLDAYAHELSEQLRKAHDEMRPFAHMGLTCEPQYSCGVAKLIDSIDPEVK